LAFSGTASSSDYTATSSVLTILAGSSSASLTLTAVDDSLDEADETVGVSIAAVSNAVPGSTTAVSASILDDDAAPTVTLSVDTTTLAEAGGQAIVTATLSTVSSKDVTVTLAFSGAASSSDYTTTS